MTTEPITEDQAKATVAAVEAAMAAGKRPPNVPGRGPAALATAATTLGLKKGSTVRERLEYAKQRYGIEPDWSIYQPPTRDAPAAIATATAERRAADQIASLTAQVRELQREVNAGEDLRQAMFGAVTPSLSIPDWTVRASPTAGAPGIPLLFTSDFQWGEVISAREMDGINEFNQKVASRRYKRLIEKTVSLCIDHMVNPDYPGIIYLRGGDAISGDIHDELRETNDLQSIPAVRDLVEHETWGIRTLAEKFGNVFVVSVPGNHGRTTKKPHSKRYADTNYDTMSAWWLEALFSDDKRVQFWTPASGDAIIPICGYRFCLTHGDRIGSRGGMGFVGPAATITRGMKKVADYYATLGTPVDVILVGHFHTAMELEYGFANGSLPGVSEYARDFRPRPAAPKQWLLFVHQDYGVTARWPILLEKMPKHPALGWDAVKRMERRAA